MGVMPHKMEYYFEMEKYFERLSIRDSYDSYDYEEDKSSWND